MKIFSSEDAALCRLSGRPLVPEDLHHAPSHLRLQEDDDEGDEDQVRVAEDIFQQQQLEVGQLVNTAARELGASLMKNILFFNSIFSSGRKLSSLKMNPSAK